MRVSQHERTGSAIIQNDREGDNCILLYGGANRAITEAQVDAALQHFGAGDWLLLQNEINQLPYIMRQAHARGMHIAFNPSPMEARVLDFPLECIGLFLLNRVEAAQLAGQDGADIPQAMELAAQAASIAVTRRGAAPSIPTLAETQAYFA